MTRLRAALRSLVCAARRLWNDPRLRNETFVVLWSLWRRMTGRDSGELRVTWVTAEEPQPAEDRDRVLEDRMKAAYEAGMAGQLQLYSDMVDGKMQLVFGSAEEQSRRMQAALAESQARLTRIIADQDHQRAMSLASLPPGLAERLGYDNQEEWGGSHRRQAALSGVLGGLWPFP